MDRNRQLNLLYFAIAMMAVVFIQSLWAETRMVQVIPYSTFEELLEEGAIDSVTVGTNAISGYFTQPRDGYTRFVTNRVPPDLVERLERAGVTYGGETENTWFATLLSWVVPALVFVGLWMFVIRRMLEKQGFSGPMSVGRSRAKIYVEKDTKVTFDDVAGVDEAKEELQEIVEFLKAPAEYGRLGARVPKGVLLVGPPGTGKTLLARAVAGEAGVPFFSISGSEFVEMFVGVGAARVRDLFEQARPKAPAIIFIDELDALGRARGAFPGIGGHDEREQTLNQLLAELDGFDTSAGIVLLAATNRPEILDPALLRAGRFDRQILVDRPDKPGRVAILKVHMVRARLADDVDVDAVAGMTTGFSGADLANLVNEAALLATRRKAEAVGMEDFTAAVERIVAGLEKKNRVLTPRERRVVAHHEIGHAIVAMALPGTDVVHKVSIIPRGIGALGYTIQRPTEDRFLMSQGELEDKIAVLLGGRAAERLVFGELSTGAADDLAKATDIARGMVMRYGMDEGLGSVSYEDERPTFLNPAEPQPAGRRVSEATARRIDAAVQGIIARAFDRATDVLTENRGALEAAAVRLLEKETLEQDELRAIAEPLRRRPTRGETIRSA